MICSPRYLRLYVTRVMKIVVTRQAGRVARMEERKCIRVLVGKHTGKRRLGGTKRRWEDIIKM